MRTTYSAGGIVVNRDGSVAITNQHGRSWSLPKGHIEPGEDKLEAARREIYEETGIKNLTLIKELGTYERPKLSSENKDNKREWKVITVFLFTTTDMKLKTHDPENPAARWVSPDGALKLLTHSKDRAFFRSVMTQIKV